VSERILTVRLRALGDVVLMTPALRALKRGRPDAEIDVVTDSRYAALLEWLPEVSHVWPLERSSRSSWGLAARLRKRRYEWALDFFGNPRSAMLVRLSGARATAGFDLRGRRYAYRVRVPRDAPGPGGRREHASAAHLRLAGVAGAVPDGEPARLEAPPMALEQGAQRLREAGVTRPARTVGLVAAGTWPTKTWPVSHAALLARVLIESGRDVALVTGPGESAVADTVLRFAPGTLTLPPCDVAGLAGIIAHLEAVVGTDSGPRHLAAALGVPTFAWFGPTHPDTWQPPGDRHGYWRSPLPCAGCDRVACPHWSCMPALTPDVAARAVLDHLDRTAHGPAADLRPAAGA